MVQAVVVVGPVGHACVAQLNPIIFVAQRIEVRVDEGCLDHGLVESCLHGGGLCWVSWQSLAFDDKNEVLVLVAAVGDP